MEKSILDVFTTIESKEGQTLKWEIKHIGLFLNSQAVQLIQEFGPLAVDNLKFKFYIRKLSVGNVEFKVLALNNKDASLGSLHIQPSVCGKNFEKFVLDFYDRSTLSYDLLSGYLNSTTSLKLEMWYENVQVRTQILNGSKNSSNSNNSDRKRNVSPKTSSTTSFDLISDVSEQNKANGSNCGRKSVEKGKSNFNHEKSNYESESSTNNERNAWTGSGNWAEDENEKTVVEEEDSDDIQTAFNNFRKSPPAQSAFKKQIRHSPKKQKVIDSSDSEPEASYFNRNVEESSNETENEVVKSHKEFEIEWSASNYNLPSTTFEAEPGSKIETLQSLFQGLHRDLYEHIKEIINSYLKGNSAILSETMNSDGKLFDLITDMKTLLAEFDSLVDYLDVDEMEEYIRYVDELKQWFDTTYSDTAKLQMDIFQKIQLHFQTVANAKQLHSEIKKLAEEYEKIDGNNFSNTSKIDAQIEKLEKTYNDLDEKANDLELTVNNLLVPEFVDMGPLRSAYTKLLQIYQDNRPYNSKNNVVYTEEDYYSDFQQEEETVFNQKSIFEEKEQNSVFEQEFKSVIKTPEAIVEESKTTNNEYESVEDVIEELKPTNSAENEEINSISDLMEYVIEQTNELEWELGEDKANRIKNLKPLMQQLTESIEEMDKKELLLYNRELLDEMKDTIEGLQVKFASFCEEKSDGAIEQSLLSLNDTIDQIEKIVSELNSKNADEEIINCHTDLITSIEEFDDQMGNINLNESDTQRYSDTKNRATELLNDLSRQLESWQKFKETLVAASNEHNEIFILLDRIERDDLGEESQLEDDVEAMELAQSETIERIEGFIRLARKLVTQVSIKSPALFAQARDKIIKVDNDHLNLMTRLGQGQTILQNKLKRVNDYVSENSE